MSMGKDSNHYVFTSRAKRAEAFEFQMRSVYPDGGM